MAMARPEFIKKAAKDNPAVKKGESYWRWSHFRGPTHYSKEQPRASRLESNENIAACYAVQEEIEDWSPIQEVGCLANEAGEKKESAPILMTPEDLRAAREDWVALVNEAKDQEQDKFDNMPEQFQQADTGQQIEERINAMQEYADELEGVDLDDEPDEDDDESEEDLIQNWLQEKIKELQAISPNF